MPISGRDVQGWWGTTFEAHNLATNQRLPLRIPSPEANWPRTGAEAYAIPVDCHLPNKTMPSVLKVFKQDVPERGPRSRYLVQLGLAKHHPWLFAAVPYVALSRLPIQNVHIDGHVARRVQRDPRTPADDIKRLRDSDQWSFDLETRRRLAGHLCCAIHALERLGVVHGDISAGNVLICAHPDGGPAAILCDFDGFHHPSQPLLPLGVRTLGSEGYQYPELLERAGDPSVFVASDRFALGAMVCEIMAWDVADAEASGRTELLDSAITRARDVGAVPAAVTRRFQPGFELLQRALQATGPAAMPAPRDWLEALGVFLDAVVTPFSGRPLISIRQRQGTARSAARRVRLTTDSGDFGRVDVELVQVSYTFENGMLKLSFGWGAPAFLRRRGRQFTYNEANPTLVVEAGDVISSRFWELQVYDDATASAQ